MLKPRPPLSSSLSRFVEMSDQFETEIYWRGELIGHLADWMPDMWYIEGRWIPIPNNVADEFTTMVSGFDAKTVYRDLTKGTRIRLRYDEKGELFDGVAISINDGNLFLRRIVDADAVQWAQENIPE